jgi:hypothetical protein
LNLPRRSWSRHYRPRCQPRHHLLHHLRTFAYAYAYACDDAIVAYYTTTASFQAANIFSAGELVAVFAGGTAAAFPWLHCCLQMVS